MSEKARMAQYEAEDDLRTLSRAEEIRNDAKRMKGCHRVLGKQERGLKRVRRSLGSTARKARGRR